MPQRATAIRRKIDMRKKLKADCSPTQRGIYIADDDRVRLEALLRRALDNPTPRPSNFAALAGELQRARVVPRSEVPPDVVTMGSTIRLRDLETGEEETYTLVYPDDADIQNDKLSVLAPVGTALLGYRTGDVVEWPVPAGVRRFCIEDVKYRPKNARVCVA